MSSDAYKYIENAIKRINSGLVLSQEGSHVAGVFGKAAQMYERLMRQRLGQILKCCQIDYNSFIQQKIKGPPLFDKLTLGMIAASFDHVGSAVPKCLNRYFCLSSDRQALIEDMKSINENWVSC